MDESASMLFCCPPCGRLVGSNGYGRCFTISKKDLLINEEIREKEVRVVDADGSQLGIMPTRQALALAIDKGLDLVDIAPQATPNVCRIMDFGKYRYEQAKREKEARKNQKVVEVKDESGQTVMVKRGLQFAESISFGFTYTIASKSK